MSRSYTSLTFLRLVAALLVLVPGCKAEGPSGPVTSTSVFDEVWERFDDEYPFFPVANVNWHALRATYRDSVAGSTSDHEAARLIGAMIAKLNDYHSGLTTPFGTFGPGPIPHDHNFVPSLLQQNYFASPIQSTGSSRINYARLKSGHGYIYIGSFAGQGWGNEIETAIESLVGVPSVILDIRDNVGGNEDVARQVAARFYDVGRVYRLSRARNGPGYTDLSAATSMSLDPGGSRRFTGHVAVITNRFNGSAAEDFLLMMRILPNVTVVGDTTLGLGSNPAEYELDNGWTVRVPRTAQSTPDGFVYQFKGLPPDVEVQWRQEEVAAGRDSYIDAAVARLASPR